jgi:hypothetical protein
MNKKSVDGHNGMLFNFPDTRIQRPCEGYCVILWQRAGLEYVDGRNANIDSGMWYVQTRRRNPVSQGFCMHDQFTKSTNDNRLHHMVHFTSGDTRWDPTGYDTTLCVPHLAVLTTSSNTERYFTSGNERTPFDFNALYDANNDIGSGYQLRPDDQFSWLVELMNMGMEDQTVYLTMTYDYLDGPLPRGWRDIKTAWIDVMQCAASDFHPPYQNGYFTAESKPWKPNFEGQIVGVMTHLHDGGTMVDVITNRYNDTLCSTEARYSETEEYTYRDTMGAMNGDKLATQHISSMDGCYMRAGPPAYMTRDQAWRFRGHYDYDLREGNLEHGKQSEVSFQSLSCLFAATNCWIDHGPWCHSSCCSTRFSSKAKCKLELVKLIDHPRISRTKKVGKFE